MSDQGGKKRLLIGWFICFVCHGRKDKCSGSSKKGGEVGELRDD